MISDCDIRYECLKLAIEEAKLGEDSHETVKRANEYYEFVTGKKSDQ